MPLLHDIYFIIDYLLYLKVLAMYNTSDIELWMVLQFAALSHYN
jgi:hypothetical protein